MARHSITRATTALTVLSIVMQGSASAGTPEMQTVRVETPGYEQAACELINDRGSWKLPLTPGTVTVTISDVPLLVSCHSQGGALGSTDVPSSLSPPNNTGTVVGGVVGTGAGAALAAPAWAFIPELGVLALLTGAALGLGTGATVDKTKHQHIRHYPELILIPMSNEITAATASVSMQPGAPLGMGIRGLSTAQALEAGLGERGAVLVTSVAANGGAAAAGLRSGDCILSMGGLELHDATDMEERVLALAPGAPTMLRVWRNGQVLELVLTRAPAAP